MADLIAFQKKQGKFYAVIKDSRVRKATVTLSASWTPSEGAPIDKIKVKGSDGNQVNIFTTGNSGVNIGSFKVNKNKRTEYEIKFDKKADAKISSDDDKVLILNQPVPSLQEAENATFISTGKNGKYGVRIAEGLQSGSNILLKMERDDDSNSDGRALTAVELPVGNDSNRMSFSSRLGYETETENIDLDPAKTDGKTFFKFDFEGLNSGVDRIENTDGRKFGDDGNTLPPGPVLAFDDEDGSFNAILYIAEKNLEIDTTPKVGLTIFLDYSDVELETAPVICKKNVELELTCPPAAYETDEFEIVANAKGVANSNATFYWYQGTVDVGPLLLSGLGETKLTGSYPSEDSTQKYGVKVTFEKEGCNITKTNNCKVTSLENPPPVNTDCNKRLKIKFEGEGWDTEDKLTFATADAGAGPLELTAKSFYGDEISTDGISWTWTEDDGTALTDFVGGGSNRAKVPFSDKCGTNRRWIVKAEYDDTGTSPPGFCNLRREREIETRTRTCPTSDPTPATPTKCGTQPPVIAQKGSSWGIEIPSNVINTSTVFLHFEKRDRPDQYGTAISKISIVGSDDEKNTIRLDKNSERDSTEGSFNVTTAYGTFYKFVDMDNIKEPLYNETLDRLEFRDQDGPDANAWIEVKDHVFNCDEVGEIIGPEECLPGPWNVEGETYDPNDYEEPVAPTIDRSNGGLQCSKDGEKDIILDLTNYRNQLVTLELTYSIDAVWTQHFDFNIPNCSDLYIDNSRHGGDENEYNVPAFSQSTNTADNQVFKIYNLDGGYKYRFNHNHDVGPEPVRDIFEKVCVEEEVTIPITDSAATITHFFDDVANVNINSPISDDDQVSVQALGLSNSGGGNTTANKHYEITFSGLDEPITADNFNQVSISGVSDQTASNPPDGVAPDGGGPGFTSGISFGRTSEFVSQNKIRVWFTSGSNNSFVRKFTVNYPGGSTATQINTTCTCELVGTQSWTETGKSWPRFQGGVFVTKTGGNSVSWVYEDGGGTTGGVPDDVSVTVTVKKVRDTLPPGTIGMNDLENYVWLRSDSPDAPYNFGPVDGQSLADWYDHSDKIRIRNPSERRSLTDLRLSGVDYSEFIRAAAAPYEAF